MGEVIHVNFGRQDAATSFKRAHELRELRQPYDASREELIEQAAYIAARLDYAVATGADQLEIDDLTVTSGESMSSISAKDFQVVYKRAAEIQDELTQQP